MPNFSDITVIVQGAVYDGITDKVIASVHQHLPNAHIIFSTCDAVVPDNITGYDELIISPDPGSYTYADRPGEKENNINRQIVNTLAGLRRTRTKYALKLRSDFVLTGNSFLSFFNTFPLVDPSYRVFDQKILSCCYFARNPNSDMPFPFHPSDLAFFGQTQDLIKLFDIPLMSKAQAYWNMSDRHQYQYVPEQYLFINCLRKNGFDANCNFYNDCRPEGIEQTERYFASNFIFLDFAQFNLSHYKNTFSIKVHPNAFMSCYTHVEWQRLYQKYIDSQITIPHTDTQRQYIQKLYRSYKKYRFIANLTAFLYRSKAKRRKVRNKILEFFLSK